MNGHVVAVRARESCKEVVRVLRSNHLDGVPVVDVDRRVLGVVTAADVLARHGAATAGELMTRPAVTVRAETTIADAVLLARRSGHRSLPVLDRFGGLVGVVTRTDLVAPLLRPDTELRADVAAALGSLGQGRPPVVRFGVAEGVVTLHAAGVSPGAADRLVARIRSVPGVVDVVPRLGVGA